MNRFCLLPAALLVCGPKPAAGSQEPPESDLSASGILEESRMAGSQLPPWERAFHLGRLIHAAQGISPETAADWAEELFWLTFALPRTWNRGAVQKNAVAELARLRPEHLTHLTSPDITPLTKKISSMISVGANQNGVHGTTGDSLDRPLLDGGGRTMLRKLSGLLRFAWVA